MLYVCVKERYEAKDEIYLARPIILMARPDSDGHDIVKGGLEREHDHAACPNTPQRKAWSLGLLLRNIGKVRLGGSQDMSFPAIQCLPYTHA